MVAGAITSGLMALVVCLVLGRKKFSWYHYLIAFVIAAACSTLLRWLIRAIWFD